MELNSNEECKCEPDVTDTGVLHSELLQFANQIAPRVSSVLAQVTALDLVKHRERDLTRHRIPSKLSQLLSGISFRSMDKSSK